uniref:Protein kinase domain-containing protein n=1 Tax=Cryptomonas curvata TaxID=233186 RepID=A0A7S0LV78_9CRYP
MPQPVTRTYHLLKPLADKEDRISWMVETECLGPFALVKAFRNMADRDHEVAIYQQLRSLQGSGLPRLRAACCQAPLRHDERKHALMLSWIGPQWHSDFSPLTRAELLRARTVLEEIHRKGVVHRDMWPRNLVRSSQAGGVCIVDFGMALTKSMMGKAAFDLECRKEMEAMDDLIQAAEKGDLQVLI